MRAVLALGVCAWVALVGIGASGAGALLPSAGAQVALAIASLCAFALVPLSLAYTLAQCGFREEALNAIANLGGMVMSFLGGAWVPLSLMGANVQAVAHFTPTQGNSHNRLKSTNLIERLNQEVRRREKIIRIFPNQTSANRLIGAVLMDLHDEWIYSSRKYINFDK